MARSAGDRAGITVYGDIAAAYIEGIFRGSSVDAYPVGCESVFGDFGGGQGRKTVDGFSPEVDFYGEVAAGERQGAGEVSGGHCVESHRQTCP